MSLVQHILFIPDGNSSDVADQDGFGNEVGKKAKPGKACDERNHADQCTDGSIKVSYLTDY